MFPKKRKNLNKGCKGINLADIDFKIEPTLSPEQQKAKQKREARRELLSKAAPFTIWDNLDDDEVLQHINFLANFYEALTPMETANQEDYYKIEFSVCLNLWDIILKFGTEQYDFGFQNLESKVNFPQDKSYNLSKCIVFLRVQRAKSILKTFHINGFKPFDFNQESIRFIVDSEPLEAVFPTINNIIEEYEKRKDNIKIENDVQNQCYFLKRYYNEKINPFGFAPKEPLNSELKGTLEKVYNHINIEANFESFSYEICFAELDALKLDLPDWKFKCLVSNLKNLFPHEWYDTVISNLQTTKSNLSKYHKVDEDWAKELERICKKRKK